jgi:methionine-rich copper-binding protein CopC
MKFTRTAGAVVMMACGALAFAHARLVKSVPANGATLTSPPANFVLTFAEPAKLTALSLAKDSGPARKLGPLPTAAAAEISIPAPQLQTGKYVLTWRAVSGDGHVMPGTLSFTVSPAGTPGQ